jgi:phthiocerol/phenolphthiocerol synthesis type-I polyketide synthase E
LPQEYGVRCCNLDIDSCDHNGAIPLLIAELTGRPSTDRIVAFRQGRRWVQQFQQNTAPLEQPAPVLKKGGVYLITGGLGQVGSLLARHLLENYQARVILIGRTQLQTVPVPCERSVRLSQLTAISNDISYRCVDVTDETAFSNTVLDIEKAIGPVNGVIHAAGNIDRRYFETSEAITSGKAMAVMASKISGLQNLYTVFENRQPDFVWITSSLSSIMGGVGFSAYAAANSFMEHLVQARSQTKPQWTCIGLSDMALNSRQPQQDDGKRLITPSELIALFEWSIGQSHLPVIYETIEHLDVRMRQAFSPKPVPFQHHRSPGDLNKTERPALKNPYLAPATDTERKLAAIIEDFLGIRQIGMEDNFYELGGDSLKGMVLLKRIRQEFNIDIALNDLFTSDNIRVTATEIESRLWLKSDVRMNNEIKI